MLRDHRAPDRVSDSALTQALNRVVLTNLEPVSLGLAAFFATMAISRFFMWPTAGEPAAVALNAATAGVLAALGIRLRRGSFGPRAAHPLGVAVAVLVIANYFVPLPLAGFEGQTPFFMLMAIGTGTLFLSYRWSFGLLAFISGTWAAKAYLTEAPPLASHSVSAMLLACVVSLGVQTLRTRNVKRSERAKLRRDLERRRREHSIEQMETGLRDLAERSKDVVYQIRTIPRARIEYVNPAVTKLIGYSPEELYADPDLAWRIVHPDDRHLITPDNPPDVAPLTIRWVHRSGEIIWTEQYLVALYEEDGTIFGFDAMVHDVTERKRIELALRHSDEQLRLALDAAGVGVWEWDIATSKVVWEEVGPLFGISAEEFQGTFESFLAVVHPDDRANITESLRAALDDERSYDVEYRILWPNGDVRWMYTRGMVFRDATGRPVRMLGHVQDVTVRKTAQLALEESEERLRLALDAAQIGIWDWDIRSGTIKRTGTTLALYGRKMGELETIEDIRRAMHPDDLPHVSEAVGKAIAGAQTYDVEYRVVLSDRETRWMASTGRAYVDGNGPYRVTGYIADVTKRKAAEAALVQAKDHAEEANRVKSAILANMSHEIRTPMTAILGYSDLLARKLKGTSLEKEALTINRGGTRLLHLLNSIIDLARIEAGRVAFDPTYHPLADTVNRVTYLLKVLAEQKGLGITVDADPSAYVYTDARAEEQVITNILSNAIRFTERGGVTVTVTKITHGAERQPYAAIRISDTGIGISPDFIHLVFDEFRQESEGIGRTHEGSGLGLAITKKLVERLGGAISIESAQGSGTTVLILLPLALHGSPEAAEPAVAPPEHDLAPKRILAVEDDAPTARLLARLLGERHELLVCENAEAALAAAAGASFDLVLMDINFKTGTLDGVQALHRLRAMPPYAAVPIIAVTAYAMVGDEERFLAEGFSGYLAKPFSTAGLLETINRALLGQAPPPPKAGG